MLILLVIRQYFSLLRQDQGHKPDASPLDLEILLIIKFIATSDGDIIDLLCRVGIILIGDQILLNGNLLTENLVTSRSRINNTLNRLRWDVVHMNNNEKWNMLDRLLSRADVRNWTMRTIPRETALYRYVRENPHVQLHPDSVNIQLEPLIPLADVIPDNAGPNPVDNNGSDSGSVNAPLSVNGFT
jgi:hypothetical protein